MTAEDEKEDTTFGSKLRYYRERAISKHQGRILSQDRLAFEVSNKLGLSISRNLVGNWENDKTTLNSQKDWQILLAIISVLVDNRGITSSEEANRLLEAGNYKALSIDERKQIFPKEKTSDPQEMTDPVSEKRQSLIQFLQEKVFYGSIDEKLKAKLAAAEEGPPPAWPRKIVVLNNWITDQWTVFHSLRVLGWIWACVLIFWLVMPSLRWPFHSQDEAFSVMVVYTLSSLSIPFFIGLLTTTNNNSYWQERPSASPLMIRLYTYQGAGLGFYLSYFAVFIVNLTLYYFGLHSNLWIELIGTIWMLISSYRYARVIPYNLWKAFKRLTLADGGIFFFVFIVFGPFWGLFFYFFHSLLLAPMTGSILLLLVLTFDVVVTAWQQKRTGTTTIPAHWWIILFGSAFVLYLLSVGYENLFIIVSLINITLAFSVLFALERIHFTLRGMIGFCVISSLLIIPLKWNLWVGRAAVGLSLLAWWLWGKKYLSFPWSFLGITLAYSASIWMLQQGWLSDIQASVFVSVITMLLLLWEYLSVKSKRKLMNSL